jgi:hypothetical protein
MKKHRIRISGLIGMVLVPQLMAAVIRFEERFQFVTQGFNLVVVQQPNAGQVTIFLIELQLLVTQSQGIKICLG